MHTVGSVLAINKGGSRWGILGYLVGFSWREMGLEFDQSVENFGTILEDGVCSTGH